MMVRLSAVQRLPLMWTCFQSQSAESVIQEWMVLTNTNLESRDTAEKVL